TVLRAGASMVLGGKLGGEPVEVVAANASVALVWPVAPLPKLRGQGEGMWIAALDVASGRELWRGTIPPATQDEGPTSPLLADGDTVITRDASDLIAVELRAAEGPRERWRLPGLGEQVANAQCAGRGLLVLNDPAHNLARLVDLASGQLLFVLPCDGSRPAVLAGGDFYAVGIDRRLACWDLGHGRLRWKSDKEYERVIAGSGDAVYATTDHKQLAVIDRFSGKQRRIFGEWNHVDEWRVVGDHLYANVRRSEENSRVVLRALAAVGLSNGAVLWERGLPRGAELRDLVADANGVLCILAEPTQKTSLARFDLNGSIIQAESLAEDETVRQLTGALLIGGTAGMRVALPVATPPTAAVPMPVVQAKDSLVATASAALPALTWQPLGRAAYALARVDRSLLVFARLPTDTDSLELRIGDAGPAIDIFNQSLVAQRQRIARFNGAEDAWRQIETRKLPGEDGVWLCVARLDPPAARPPGTALLVRGMGDGACDGGPGPWWLRQGWRLVTETP
nr:PQQ-binding-like beta-propeller repeat protein [Planctomycetota bacterium]